MKKAIYTLLLVICFLQFANANNLQITNVTKVSDNELTFDVSWDNSWNVSSFHDAAWIFVKYKNSLGQWQHVDISGSSNDFNVEVQTDTKGIMIYRNTNGKGSVSGTVHVVFNGQNLGPFPDFKVFGIEMVYINSGPFYLGDGGTFNGRFFKGSDNTKPYQVQNSGIMTVGNTSADINNYFFSNISTSIPATYPNGYDAFYIMKYEITQEQYVEFLNTLTPAQKQNRTETDLTNINGSNRFVMQGSGSIDSKDRNGIACSSIASLTNVSFFCDLGSDGNGNEIYDGQNVACSRLSINDNLAYLDWAALRPITDMEFEKASRGPLYPVPGELANGSATVNNNLGAIANAGKPDETVANIGANNLMITGNNQLSIMRVGILSNASTSTRLQTGASYYGVLNLSDNLQDMAFFVDQKENNTFFTGILGDGALNASGDNDAWDFSTGNNLGNIFIAKGSISNSIPVSDMGYGQPLSNFSSRIDQNFIRGVRQQQ